MTENDIKNNGTLVFDLFHKLIFEFMGVSTELTFDFFYFTKKINYSFRRERNLIIENDYLKIKDSEPKKYDVHKKFSKSYKNFVNDIIKKLDNQSLSRLIIPNSYLDFGTIDDEQYNYYFKIFNKKKLNEKIELFNKFIIKAHNYEILDKIHDYSNIKNYIYYNIYRFKAEYFKDNYEKYLNKIKNQFIFNISIINKSLINQ